MILPQSERFRPNCVLAAILALALALRLWGLDRNGFGNQYYSAGVRSMLESWHNFFFNAFDPAGFVSLDKPPVAFWIQVAAAKLFGFSGFSVLLPQALEGAIAVALLYVIVRKPFGVGAGLLAALFLAITPISVAVDRSSNTDTCLVMVLLLAAWALSRAAESGSRTMLLLSMAVVGIAFNVKMLAAFIVLPTFALVYLSGAPIGLRQRLMHLTLGGVVLTAVSLSWSVAYDLTPPEDRPYVGGTTENSMLELVVGHNGLQRFLSHGRRGAALSADSPAAPQSRPLTARPNAADNEPAGPFRLFSPRLAGQVSWLLPFALLGLLSFDWRGRTIWPPDPVRRGLTLWGGWAITYGVVYSALSRLSPYYLSAMGPPLCALAGIGAMKLWDFWKEATNRSWLPPVALIFAATWEAYIAFGSTLGTPGWTSLLNAAPLAGALLAVAGLIAVQSPKLPRPAALRVAAVSYAVGFSALLVNPASWSLNSVMTAGGNDARPIAGPPGATVARNDSGQRRSGGGRFGLADEQKLTAFLLANYTDERYLAATPSARLAAPIIIRTGSPIMAVGGFSGSDPILAQDALARMVANKEIRFMFVGGVTGLGQTASVDTNRKLTDWVIENGSPVDPDLWRVTPTVADAAARRGQGRRLTVSGVGDLIVAPLQLYDLNPKAGALRPSPD